MYGLSQAKHNGTTYVVDLEGPAIPDLLDVVATSTCDAP